MLRSALLYSSGYLDGLCGTPCRELPPNEWSQIYHQGYRQGVVDSESTSHPDVERCMDPSEECPQGWDSV